MEPEIIDYIKKTRSHGMSDLEIKQNLLNAGWEAGTVEENFAHLKALDNQSLSNKDEDIKYQNPIQTKVASYQHVGQTTVITGSVQASTGQQADNEVTSAKPFYKKAWVYIVLVMLLALGGVGGYWYYAFGFNSADKVWATFSKGLASKVYKQDFKFSYSDPGSFTNQLMGSFQLKDLNFSMDGSSYSDLTDIKNPQSKTDVRYTFGSGTTNMSTEFKFRLLDKILYLNVGENPFLNSVVQELAAGKKVDWIKIDLNALEEEANKQAQTSDPEYKKKMDQLQEFSKELGKIWEDGTFVKVDKSLGREKINNVYTFHFKNSLDKDAVKAAFNLSVDKSEVKIKELSTNLTPKDLEDIHKVMGIAKISFADIMDKLEVKEFETWIGMKDFRLYQVKFNSNAPSLISLVENLVGGFTADDASRDAKRLADMRQMASALELYFNDNNSYPEGKDGKPIGVTPIYISALHEAPAPADGSCTDYYNNYWYEAKKPIKDSSGKTAYLDYEIYFCLGATTGGYNGGIGKLSASGIVSNIACPTTPEQCAKPVAAETVLTDEQKVKDMIQKIKFSAEIKVQNNYSDYNKVEKIEVPENSFDLMDVIKGKVQGLFIKNPEA